MINIIAGAAVCQVSLGLLLSSSSPPNTGDSVSALSKLLAASGGAKGHSVSARFLGPVEGVVSGVSPVLTASEPPACVVISEVQRCVAPNNCDDPTRWTMEAVCSVRRERLFKVNDHGLTAFVEPRGSIVSVAPAHERFEPRSRAEEHLQRVLETIRTQALSTPPSSAAMEHSALMAAEQALSNEIDMLREDKEAERRVVGFQFSEWVVRVTDLVEIQGIASWDSGQQAVLFSSAPSDVRRKAVKSGRFSIIARPGGCAAASGERWVPPWVGTTLIVSGALTALALVVHTLFRDPLAEVA